MAYKKRPTRSKLSESGQGATVQNIEKDNEYEQQVQKQLAQRTRCGAAVTTGEEQSSRGGLCPMFGFLLDSAKIPSENSTQIS